MSSLTFKILRRMHIISNEEKHGNISFFGAIGYAFETAWRLILFKYCYSSFILEPLNLKKIRCNLWRKIGCHMGKDVLIGHSVALDYGNADMITIEDKVVITNCCILLCHRRDMKDYKKGDDAFELPYIYAPITLKKGCQIGMGSIIMPGVTVGEGAIVGAHSVVTRDVPAWTIAVGSPAKVIKEL